MHEDWGRYQFLWHSKTQQKYVRWRVTDWQRLPLCHYLLGWKKKKWNIEHINDLKGHGYFSPSRSSIWMQFSKVWSLVFFPSSKEIYLEIWCHQILTECLKTFWKFFYIIWPLCSNTHADPMLYGKWSKWCRGATHEKDVLITCNNCSPNLSCLKDLNGAVRPNFPKWGIWKV